MKRREIHAPCVFSTYLMNKAFLIKLLLLMSCLTGSSVNIYAQITINQADDFLCKADEYYAYGQFDSILYYAEHAIAAFESAGDWESYIQAMMKKGGALRDKRLLHEAQNVYEKALFTAMSSLNSSDPTFTRLYSGLGQLALWQTNYPEAITWFSKQIKAEPDKTSINVAGAEINMALVYVYLWRFEEARTHCEIGIEILKKMGISNHPYVSNAYMNIGLCYSNEAEYQLALSYFEKALEILEQSNTRNKSSIANIYGNISNMHNYLKNYDKALTFLEKSLALQKEVWGEKHTWVAHCYHNFGLIHFNKGNAPLGVEFTKKALDIRKELLPLHHKDIIKTYTFLGSCYIGMGQIEMALDSYKEGIKHREAVNPLDIELVFAHEGMAKAYAKGNKYKDAILELNKAIQILKPGGGWAEVKNGPKLVTYLTMKAQYLEKQIPGLSGDEKRRTQDEALQCYQDACDLSNFIQRQRHDDASKNKIAESGQKYGKAGLKLAFSLYEASPTRENLELVFWFMENNKASLLHEAVQKSQAELLAGIPDSLRDLERTLSLDFSFYDQQLQHENSLGAEADTLQLKKLKETTFTIRQRRDSLRKALERDYPVFRWLAFEAQHLDLSTVQSQLGSPDALMLEYAFVDSALYVIAISPAEVRAFHTSWQEEDIQLFEAFIQFLHNDQLAQNEGYGDGYLKSYEHYAWSLYQKLVSPALSAFPQTQKITIIPDKGLGYLPFEALLTAPLPSQNSNSYSDLPLALKSFAFKYNYAASLSPGDSLIMAKHQGPLGAFAPQYDGEELASSREIFKRFASENQHTFSRLPATATEVSAIQEIMGGETWEGPEATKKTFLAEASKYRFLHLAMHAFTNDSFPLQSGLVFSPGKDRFLYSYEIYNLPLQAELTVLSACHTGFGKYQQGEGIMSLARAFRYAGSPNIVMSLWQADDESTAQLMTFFYQNLQAGMGKDEALRQAKISYIAEGGKPMPYYWAGFVLMGDGEPLELGKDNNALLWGGGVVLLFLLGFFWWRRR
jgi:CHAT domain-containing protein/tetratricopeptide (TPR) repeat protein